MTTLTTISVPCKFCSAQPGNPCRTKKGRRYYPTHIKRRDLLSYLNDGTIARLLKRSKKAA